MMKKFTLAIATFICIAFVAPAQDAPVFSQFWQNPFQFNPSYAAHQGYSEINVFYRKQWLGIENAPSIGAFNIQTPLGRNVSTGLTLVSNKTILLNASTALGTFAYRVRLGAYHNLNFGLAAGIGFNNFDLDAIANANDPALANIIPQSQYLTGQFGINYRYRNFNFGIALPNLFDTRPNTQSEFQKIKFDPFRNKFGTVSYSIGLNEILLTPTVIYRALDNQQTQWEGMLLATYKGFLWAGVSYRDGYGLTGLLGVRLKNNYKVGYAYEHPTNKALRSAASGSHELYFGMRLGKRDREADYALEKKKADSLQQIANAEKAGKEQEKIALAEKEKLEKAKLENEKAEKLKAEKALAEKVLAEQQEKQKQPETTPVIETAVAKPETLPADTTVARPKPEPPADYYVVLGSYRVQANALKQMRELRDKGLLPEMLYNLSNNTYHVYLFKTDNRQAALEELTRERNRNRFQGVWLHKVPRQTGKN